MSLFISLINHSLYFVKALVHGGLEKKVALYHTQSAECCSRLWGKQVGDVLFEVFRISGGRWILALAPVVESPDGLKGVRLGEGFGHMDPGIRSGSALAFVWMWGGVSHSLNGARWLTVCEGAAIPVEVSLSSCLIFVCPCSSLP